MPVIANTVNSSIVTEYQITNFYMGSTTTINGTPTPVTTTTINLNYERRDYVVDALGNKIGTVNSGPIASTINTPVSDNTHFGIGLATSDLDTHVYDQTKSFSENLMIALEEHMSKDLATRKLI